MVESLKSGQGGRERELTQWILGETSEQEKVLLVCNPNAKASLAGCLMAAGVPAERLIAVENPETFDPRDSSLMVVADLQNRSALHRTRNERGGQISCLLAVPPEDYKRITHGSRGDDEFPVIHDQMKPDKLEGILLEEVMTVLEGRLPETTRAGTGQEGGPVDDRAQQIARARELIGEKKIMVSSRLFSNPLDAERVFRPLSQPGQVEVVHSDDDAYGRVSSNPNDYAVVLSSSPELLNRLKANPGCAGVCRLKHSYRRYHEGIWVAEAKGAGAHGLVTAHEMPDAYFARLVADSCALRDQGKDLTSPGAEKTFDWTFGHK
ncbi:MAG: hypothetical protein GF416_09255 [Candidatus Altiarchaeales archaeon]|nr:hypothetical protein [Candidatus Altiarchaeales archaeon]MBD3417306.1 hypothetical protein [Candidatus Altiarchaeales archaeon]